VATAAAAKNEPTTPTKLVVAVFFASGSRYTDSSLIKVAVSQFLSLVKTAFYFIRIVFLSSQSSTKQGRFAQPANE
jgi:hypothetical protein